MTPRRAARSADPGFSAPLPEPQRLCISPGAFPAIRQISLLSCHPLPPHHPSASCDSHWLPIQLTQDQDNQITSGPE